MSEEAKWYVVHTYSGYENKVATNIEKAVENRGMHELIQEVKVPTETVTEIKDNKKREVERKIFPGYVLIKMIMTDESWYIVRNTRGCTGFVGPSSKPIPLTEKEVAALGVEKRQIEINYGGRRYHPDHRRADGRLCRHCERTGCGKRQGQSCRFHVWARNPGGAGAGSGPAG